MTPNFMPAPHELAGAIRDAGEATRRQLVVEFGGMLSNDPKDARRRLAKVAAQVNLSNSTLDSFGERSPESQLFAAATSLLNDPPRYFTRDAIVGRMRAHGAAQADVASIEATFQGTPTNIGFEPAALAHHKVSSVTHLVANGARFGWDNPSPRAAPPSPTTDWRAC